MLNNLVVKNFKCFTGEQSFRLKPLTILCGENAVGKSTILQSLLLLRRATSLKDPIQFLSLNDPDSLELGRVSEVVCNTATDDDFRLSIESENNLFAIDFETAPAFLEDLHLTIAGVRGNHSPFEFTSGLSSFTYLSAERFGPRDTYRIVPKQHGELEVGFHGEWTAQILTEHERLSIRSSIAHPADKTEQLRPQVEAWMSEILTPLQLRTERSEHSNVCSLLCRLREKDSEWRRLANVGFGLTYALPIFVSALSAPEGGILIVDSPEAHLHPGAQSRMGSFLARVAKSGVQVIVETHSDHVVNGARKAIAIDKTIPPEDVVFHSFSCRDNDARTHEEICLNLSGDFNRWPAGFFDQIQIDLSAIIQERIRGANTSI